VVAHSLSVIGVQAGAARLVLDTDPDPRRAREAVAAIEATANRAMAEMRRALGILRDTEQAGAALAPLPGLPQLPALLDQVRTAGLPVDLTVEGTPRPLATSIDLSLYRIVQEALTNALKHAGATRAEVIVRYAAHDVRVEVADDGRRASPTAARSEGAGTIGMRERVALFGGELRVGPRPQGGYAVRVCLPISAGEP
jgi:signal transduction histidine kinase